MSYFSFEAGQKRSAARLRQLRKQRIRAEARLRLSKLEQKEVRRINLAKAATKSRSAGLVSWGKKTLDNKRVKKLRKEFDI